MVNCSVGGSSNVPKESLVGASIVNVEMEKSVEDAEHRENDCCVH